MLSCHTFLIKNHQLIFHLGRQVDDQSNVFAEKMQISEHAQDQDMVDNVFNHQYCPSDQLEKLEKDFSKGAPSSSGSSENWVNLDLARNQDKPDNKQPLKTDHEASSKNRKRMPDKERAKKARERKKKYYEDLEKRVEHLESKCKQLSDELEYCKHKLLLYEKGPGNTIEEKKMNSSLFQRVEKYLSQSNADDEKLREFMTGLTKKFGAFGKEKLRIVDNSFDMLIENILSGSSLKLVLYVANKARPSNLKEYEEFKNMKKFEQYEKCPDETMRTVILNEANIFPEELHLENYLQNQLNINRRVYSKLEEGRFITE